MQAVRHRLRDPGPSPDPVLLLLRSLSRNSESLTGLKLGLSHCTVQDLLSLRSSSDSAGLRLGLGAADRDPPGPGRAGPA